MSDAQFSASMATDASGSTVVCASGSLSGIAVASLLNLVRQAVASSSGQVIVDVSRLSVGDGDTVRALAAAAWAGESCIEMISAPDAELAAFGLDSPLAVSTVEA